MKPVRYCTYPGCNRRRSRKLYCPGHQAQVDAGQPLAPLHERAPVGFHPDGVDVSCLVCDDEVVRVPLDLFRRGEALPCSKCA